uniref:Transmembrane p24 trafficking protein 5 n=1 Tax=Gallus gallus TaxID=9031 RepID=A0A8V0ZSG7_CHICK
MLGGAPWGRADRSRGVGGKLEVPRCRHGSAAAAAAAGMPGAAPVASRRRRVQPVPGQRLHLHAAGRPEGVLLPAYAQGGLAGARVPGETLVFDERKSDGVHTVETEEGDYMFCFDNTFSTISEKVIFFELILDNMGEEGQDQEDWKKYVTGTDLLDMKLEDILESINSVKARLSKSVQIQTLLRAFEARDRNIQESNFDRVNFWSMVNLGVMVVVSAVQVYMLKSLFEDKRKSRT